VEDEGPPRSFEDPPPVVLWFKVYAALFAVAALGAAVAIPYLLLELDKGKSPALLALAVGVPLFLVFLGGLVPLVVRPRPWVWNYGLVLILLSFFLGCGLGLLSLLIFAFSVPLLVYWLKPETKRWYGRKP